MQDDVLISEATRKNWERLGKSLSDNQANLSKRANKRYSTKKIIPVEYFTNPETISIVEKIINQSSNIKSTIYTLAINVLRANGLINIEEGIYTSDNKYILEILDSFSGVFLDEELLNLELPKERDLLGIIYQCLMSEGCKNLNGSYYTPKMLIQQVLKSVSVEDKFLDPCCGTGSFLIEVSEFIENPSNIYGCDLDEIACFIAKINLVVKFKNIKFKPNIFHCDFLLSEVFDKKSFDVIATNPPWGAITMEKYKKIFSEIKSDEIFSYFIVQSAKFLKADGRMHFILPESILNVKVHQDIRKFILENLSILEICMCGKAFAGVFTGVVVLSLSSDVSADNVISIVGKNRLEISQEFYNRNPYFKFSILGNKDVKILDKIYAIPHLTLKNNAQWGLGIVTGNNEKHISNNFESFVNPQKIYSGKNIKKGEILDSNNFIDYQRDKFQQVAPDDVYNATEKLVYKFISKNLVFAYDDKQRLFLNSANILIPRFENYSIKDVMMFLNSILFQYIYTKRFDELKILKNNLLELPFPNLDKNELKDLTDDKIFEFFNLSPEEIVYIKNEVGAK